MSDEQLRCPTCGRFVDPAEGYTDLPPGGVANVDYLEGYCDEACAKKKPARCLSEDDLIAIERGTASNEILKREARIMKYRSER